MAFNAAPLKPAKRAPDVPDAPPRDAQHGDLPAPYSPYSPPDSPNEDDENASLRSQALNADGTPRRPMNAFMIFARRRRPQVSAANQMMRTGEISKILSREWNTMSLPDKQFYLDQAKKLKESFNAKYPDYVYRRRPNNSRKKRRTDPSARGVDAYGDPRDDSLSPHEHSPTGYHSVSPIDGLAPNEQSISLAAQGYRLPYASAHHHFHADAPYPYYHPHRLAHHAHAHAHAPPYDASPASSAALSPLLAGVPYAPAHSPGIYHPDDDAHVWGAAGAFPRIDPPIKLESAAWSAAARRRPAREPYPLPPPAHHARNWSESSASTAGGGAFPPFQTLTAPFFPSSGTVSPSTASSSSAASHASSYFGAVGTGQAPPPAQEREPFDAHAAAPAPAPAPPATPFPAQGALAPRAYPGQTVGGTLALSPASAWSSVRTKSEL